MVIEYEREVKATGYFDARRKEQALQAFTDTVEETIRQKFFNNPDVMSLIPGLQKDILSGKISPYAAALRLVSGH